MMTRARKRNAGIVSSNRLWTWQRQAILRLSRNYDVDKYYTNAAPPYPRSLTAWLHFEQEVFWQLVSVEDAEISHSNRSNFRGGVRDLYSISACPFPVIRRKKYLAAPQR